MVSRSMKIVPTASINQNLEGLEGNKVFALLTFLHLLLVLQTLPRNMIVNTIIMNSSFIALPMNLCL